MMPDNVLSTVSFPDKFLTSTRTDVLIDYAFGARDIGDTTLGMRAFEWKCFYENSEIKISNASKTISLFKAENVKELSFAFDANMRPLVCYLAEDHLYLWWYDSAAASQVTTDFGTGYKTPHLSLDDNRSSQSSNADVIFAYIKEGRAFIRIQRERFTKEYEIATGQKILQIGMMKNNRFGFLVYDWGR